MNSNNGQSHIKKEAPLCMFLRRTGCTSLEREEHTKQALAIGALVQNS